MKTVKEISEMTGNQRAHASLLRRDRAAAAHKKSEAGYRLYDDKALEMLQQILFFREFDIPLKRNQSSHGESCS